MHSMKNFVVSTRHDKGITHITTPATDADAALRIVKAAEKCPDGSILSVYEINESRFLLKGDGSMLRIKPAPSEIKQTPVPRSPYATGYGERIPTGHMIKGQGGKWHRVYFRQFSNVGTAWVNHPTGYRAIVEIEG